MKNFFAIIVVLGLLAACSSYSSTTSQPEYPQQAAPAAQPVPASVPAPVEQAPTPTPQPAPQPVVAPAPQPTPTPQVSSPSEVKISISGFKFVPSEVTVKAGTKVTWTNQDGAAHTVEGGAGMMKSDDLAKGESYSVVMSKPGTYSYACGIHPSMSGKVVVE